MRRLLIISFAAAAISLLVPSEPGYDAWAWLLWGREIAALDLDTVAGPAFKPLPVAINAAPSLFGGAAPEFWLLVARTAAVAAILFAGLLAQRLCDGSRVAAVVAAGGVALCTGWWWNGAIGAGEGLFLALVLAACLQALASHHGAALSLAFAGALMRPEFWPFLGAYGLWLWRDNPALRPWLVATAISIPALWLLPELWGSGDPFRSSERARIPNPGQPATEQFPAWASLREALAIPLVPVIFLALISRRRLLLAACSAWIGLVAMMSEIGYSGEPRYALPGAAMLCVAAGCGAVRLSHRWLAVAVAVMLPFAIVRAGSIGGELNRAHDDALLWRSLRVAIERAGGAERVLQCGLPTTGRYRGTGVAYALGIHRRQLLADGASRQGLVVSSRVRPSAMISPAAFPGARVVARSPRWVLRCSVRAP